MPLTELKTLAEAREFLPVFEVTTVLYHGECPDGVMAAAVHRSIWRVPSAVYIPCVHGMQAPPAIPPGSNVLMLDFTLTAAGMAMLAQQCKRLLVIDHHVGNRDRLREIAAADNAAVYFEESRCGALLTWEYVYGAQEKPAPRVLTLIDNMDRWIRTGGDWDDTCAFHLAVARLVDTNDIDGMGSFLFDHPYGRGVQQEIIAGRHILVFRDARVRQLVQNGFACTFAGHPCIVVNTAIFGNEVGEQIYTQPGQPIAFIWYESSTRNLINVSLRCAEGIDVSAIARRLGGGGHPRASGFNLALGTNILQFVRSFQM